MFSLTRDLYSVLQAVATEPAVDGAAAAAAAVGSPPPVEAGAVREELESARLAEALWAERARTAEQELAALRARLEEEGLLNGPTPVTPETKPAQWENEQVVVKSKTKDKLPKTASQGKVNKGGAEVKETKEGKEAKEEKKPKLKKEMSKPSEDIEESSEEELPSDDEPDSEEERRRELIHDRKKKMRDLKMCKSKVWHINTKEKHAKEERIQLKNRIKTLNHNLKDENRKYKELQREVRKLGAMMKGSEDEDSEDEDEEESEEEESEESSSEESDSETDDESSDESETDDEGLPLEDRVNKMQERSRRHENNEKAIKKGNYMLKTTAERLFDKLRNEKEKYRALERELNELVNELG